jgi:hypothetical protein
MDAQLTGFSLGGADPGQLDVQVGGSTTSTQTTTAADALEIDVPPRHQRYAQAGLGDGHEPILPRPATGPRHQVKFPL